MTKGFVRWTLRTTDVTAARAFYGGLLREGAPEIDAIPASVLARGAKPHWLGHLAAVDAAAAVERWVARGAVKLGGGELVRDPSGAILAVTGEREKARRDVVWQQLLVADPARAARDYGELFGMKLGARVEIAGHGSFVQFAWGRPAGAGDGAGADAEADAGVDAEADAEADAGADAGADAVPTAADGSIGDLAGKPHIHPQWLFFFRVADLDAAMTYVREHGGVMIGPTSMPDGSRVAVCDDPQGAAFALMSAR